jgi:hypothetical protein
VGGATTIAPAATINNDQINLFAVGSDGQIGLSTAF